MNKWLIVSVIIIAAFSLIQGCNVVEDVIAEAIDKDTAAEITGAVAASSNALTYGLIAVMGVPTVSSSGLNAQDLVVPSVTVSRNADGFFETEKYKITDSSSSNTSFDVKEYFKLYNNSAEYTSWPLGSSDTITKAEFYSTIDGKVAGETFNYKFGAKSDLIIINLSPSSGKLSGKIEGSTSKSEVGITLSIAVTIQYTNLELYSTPYPTGPAIVTVKVNGDTKYTGTLTLDGTQTAKLTLDSTNYQVNLLTGIVTNQ